MNQESYTLTHKFPLLKTPRIPHNTDDKSEGFTMPHNILAYFSKPILTSSPNPDSPGSRYPVLFTVSAPTKHSS